MYIIDANVIIRFLVQDNEMMYKKSFEIFEKVENSKIKVLLEGMILSECYYVLSKVYKVPKAKLIPSLKQIVLLENIICEKVLLFETLNILERKSIDFADAYLKAKSSLQNLEILSFDKDILK